MKKGLIFGLMFLVVLAFSTPAKAIIVVNDWTLDLSGVDSSLETINDISQITFLGVAHVETVVDVVDAGGNTGTASVGDIGVYDSHLVATQLTGTGGGIIPSQINNWGVTSNPWEMTFDLTEAAQYTSVTGASINYSHIAPGTYGGETADGILDIYIDWNFSSANFEAANTVTGDGYTEVPTSMLIARLLIQTGPAGVFTPTTFDGAVDASFTAFWVKPGIFLDSLGNSLHQTPELIMMAITDSNFDGDPDGEGYFSHLEPTNWGAYFASRLAGGDDSDSDGYADNSSSMAFYALEDGSAKLGVIPEPATMLLLGSGLFGLGFFGRKRTKK
ncbi:MAG: PEP-CTERM sorting domain-containing protein [Deltaproteobacteria bacterium]|nr:PEP-CTERM sorting domain-containing protein [Deltaproteobacteria bacterium]